MRVGIVEVLGAEEVNNVLETEFAKEVSTLEIKRELVPTIDDAALGARRLVEDHMCDFIVVGYDLEDMEKLSQAFQLSILNAQYDLKKNIFRVIVPHDKKTEEYCRDAAKEIVRYFYKPEELQHEKSTMTTEQEETAFNPFAMFG